MHPQVTEIKDTAPDTAAPMQHTMSKAGSRAVNGLGISAANHVLSAAERLFGIAELFEIIFTSLPPSDIIRCRRVSKVFHHGVKTSPILQAILCFSPITLPGTPRYPPLKPCCVTLYGYHHEYLTCRISGSIEIFSVQRILGNGALWEDMYITQPPIKTAEIFYKAGNIQIVQVLRIKAGIKFKDLVREMALLAKSIPKSHKVRSASNKSSEPIVFAGPVGKKQKGLRMLP
ncbi:hypothetical protein LTR17_004274 [Elasticomyces elasticus]|nr:hypothetical protein LTR17_004274 [Elasticomyces elasticus]